MVIFTKLAWIESQPRLLDWAQASGHDLVEAESAVIDPSRPGVLLTREADISNLEMLRHNQAILALLPIRDDQATEDIEKTIAYLDRMDPAKNSFVLSNHVVGFENFQFQVALSEDRWKLIEQLGDYARSKPVFETFPDMVKTIASELLTNAFYNAPQDAQGRPIQPNRGQGVTIVPPRYVDFSYGDDGSHIWLRVGDPFGTFSRNKLLEHLMSCASRDQLVVRDGIGGAGIGLFMVFRWATQLLFVFEPGRETFVLVKLLKTKRMRTFDSQRVIFEVLQRPESKLKSS